MPKRPAPCSILSTCLLLSAAPAHAQAAPPLVQSSADCARPQYASDTLVCSDAALTAADVAVAALAVAPPALAAGAIWEPQSDWFRRRALCAFTAGHRACLAAAYLDRNAVLAAAAATTGRPVHCNGPWQGRAVVASLAVAGQPVIFRDGGLLLAVATPAHASWQPALAWSMAGRTIRLAPRGGRTFACRLAHP